MLDVSLGQLIVVGVVGATVTGRKDLPHAFRFVGTQVGRIVGLLQGARARADQYAAQNELKQLQNELRSGLRELDQVRMELAIAASSQGMVGRNLGALTPSANRQRMGMVGGPTAMAMPSTPVMSTLRHPPSAAMSPPNVGYPTTGVAPSLSTVHASTTTATSTSSSTGTTTSHVDDTTWATISTDLSSAASTGLTTYPLPPMPRGVSPSTTSMLTSHSEKAALEEEWEKQGIGYQTRAEQLYKERRRNTNLRDHHHQGGTPEEAVLSGSELLESLIRQQLLWDQYDRVVAEQDSHVQRRLDARTAITTTTPTETTGNHDGSTPDTKP